MLKRSHAVHVRMWFFRAVLPPFLRLSMVQNSNDILGAGPKSKEGKRLLMTPGSLFPCLADGPWVRFHVLEPRDQLVRATTVVLIPVVAVGILRVDLNVARNSYWLCI